MLLLRVSLFVCYSFFSAEVRVGSLHLFAFPITLEIFGHAVKNDTYHNQRAFIGLCIGCQFYRLSLVFVHFFALATYVFFFLYFGRLSQVEAVQQQQKNIPNRFFILYRWCVSFPFSSSIFLQFSVMRYVCSFFYKFRVFCYPCILVQIIYLRPMLKRHRRRGRI